MKAVFNSSPIIFLTKLGIIEAVLDLFDRIDIPSLVYSEIRRKPDASAEAVEDLLKGKRVLVSKAENERFVSALGRRLGKGEAEAIPCLLKREPTLLSWMTMPQEWKPCDWVYR